MSSLEHTQKSGQEENEPMDYEAENQKLKEEIALLKQSLATISPLFAIGMCSDVTLLVEGKKMAVHQNVLSAHSPVLADALLKRGQSEDGVLVITGTKADTFEMLLRFLYTGQVPWLKRKAATELMVAAKEYQVDGLKKCLIGRLVTRLPDLVLKALFRQMTLKDQIGARKVCRRWADLVLEATSKRRQLTLLLGEYSIEEFEDVIDKALFKKRLALKLLLNLDGTAMYPTRRHTFWNSLRLDSLDQATAEMIASTFTGAKELQVAVIKDLFIWDSLAHLLEQWSHQLATLQFFENRWNTDDQTTTRLFAAINAQSTLKKLRLHLNTIPVPDLSIVSQLEELHFYSFCTTAEQFSQWLQQYGEDNQGLARIEYHNSPSSDLKPFTALSEPLRHCFTRLFFYENPVTITGHFRSLTSLALSPTSINVRQLFTHLATLHQLIHLHLDIGPKSFTADDLEHYLLLPQVKSVKALDLMLWYKTSAHQELAQMKISWTLPNVEVIHFDFYYFRCSECNIKNENFRKPSEQAKSCLRQLYAPLKRACTKLRLIEHNTESVSGTAEELLAE